MDKLFLKNILELKKINLLEILNSCIIVLTIIYTIFGFHLTKFNTYSMNNLKYHYLIHTVMNI